MGYQLFAKAGNGSSQLLQMKHSGGKKKTPLLYSFQINSLDFNTNKTNRKGICEHITGSQKSSLTQV